MILQTLVLHNFRKFKHITIEFPIGVIGVIGLNGSGKSTIFEAIAWVLYGSVAARTSADIIKRNGAEPSDPCRVELTFSFDGNIYNISREMTGKSLSPSATIYMNEKQVAMGAGETVKYVQKILGMDYKSFYTSIFAKQKELNALSSMNASERRPLILKMLGVDALDEVIKDISSDRRTETSLIDALQKSLLDQEGRNKIDSLNVKNDEIDTQKKQVNAEIETVKAQLKDLKDLLKKHQENTDEKRKISETITKTYEQLIEMKTRYDHHEKLVKDISILEQKISQRDQEMAPLQKKILSFPDLSVELSHLEKRLHDLDSETQEYLKLIEQKKAHTHELTSQMTRLQQKKNGVHNLGPQATCPTCERILGDQFQFLLSKYTQESKEKTDEIQSLEKDITLHQENHQRLKREITALKKKKEFLYGQQTEKKALSATLASLNKELSKEQAEKQIRQKELQTLGTTTFNPEIYLRIKQQVKTAYQEYQRELKKHELLKDTYNSTQLTIEKKQSTLTILKKEKTAIQERIKELKQTEKTIKEKQKIAEEISLLQETMISFRSYIISRIRPALSSYASSFFQELTDGKYQEISLDEQYNMFLIDEGQAYTIERFSGGEIDLANLCIRLAISEIITERSQGAFQFIILDEIFGSQDAIRQQNIMEALYRLSNKFYQIFLITHVEDVKHHMRYVLLVEESNGISSVQIA
ncbi:MAG: SMC family ATPase [Thermoplasmatota archaeon]